MLVLKEYIYLICFYCYAWTFHNFALEETILRSMLFEHLTVYPMKGIFLFLINKRKKLNN